MEKELHGAADGENKSSQTHCMSKLMWIKAQLGTTQKLAGILYIHLKKVKHPYTEMNSMKGSIHKSHSDREEEKLGFLSPIITGVFHALHIGISHTIDVIYFNCRLTHSS